MAEVSSRAQKRKPSIHDSLENEQRLAKRFDLLNIGQNGGKRYIPLPADQQQNSRPRSQRPPRPMPTDDDVMRLEDTKDKIYIYDLDSELAELESDEENPVFIPEIEKHLNKIPKQVLVSHEPRSLANNQLVLYGVPNSLTMPEEHDNVRKAIIEARERARERQISGDVPGTLESMPPQVATSNQRSINTRETEHDTDVMDMD